MFQTLSSCLEIIVVSLIVSVLHTGKVKFLASAPCKEQKVPTMFLFNSLKLKSQKVVGYTAACCRINRYFKNSISFCNVRICILKKLTTRICLNSWIAQMVTSLVGLVRDLMWKGFFFISLMRCLRCWSPPVTRMA